MKREFLVFGIVESVEPNGNIRRVNFKQGVTAIDKYTAISEYKRSHSVDGNGLLLTYPEIDAVML